MQAHPLLQVVLCTPEPIEIPGVECVTYELEDLGVDNMAQILTSLAPQVTMLLLHAVMTTCTNIMTCHHHFVRTPVQRIDVMASILENNLRYCVLVTKPPHRYPQSVASFQACMFAEEVLYGKVTHKHIWLHVQIGDRAQELAEACGGRPLAAHMVGTAILSGTAQLEEVLQAVASPAVAHLQPLDRFGLYPVCFTTPC